MEEGNKMLISLLPYPRVFANLTFLTLLFYHIITSVHCYEVIICNVERYKNIL